MKKPMKIVLYGGSFNPPHIGHIAAAKAAKRQLKPDKLLIIPDCAAPHKDMPEASPTPEQRLALCRLSFDGIPDCEVSDIEIGRGGKSYTCDTLRQLKKFYPGASFTLLVGTDMLCSFDQWKDFRWILENAALAAFPREKGEGKRLSAAASALKKQYGAKVELVDMKPTAASSTELRSLLPRREGRELLQPDAYDYIIAQRLYAAAPEWKWLRKKAYAMLKDSRVPHVQGCEQEALRLAGRWGADPDAAAEAAILHDITKKYEREEQLNLCEKYGIITDAWERGSGKLMHALTGAAVARAQFGCSDEVCRAIRWHTTGRADMALLEKVIYLADYIEPTRSFEGVEALRRLAYEDIDRALALGFSMSLEDVRAGGEQPHPNTVAALSWYGGGEHG